MKCPYDPQGHGEQGDRNALAIHIQANHPEALTPAPIARAVPINTPSVEKKSENLDEIPQDTGGPIGAVEDPAKIAASNAQLEAELKRAGGTLPKKADAVIEKPTPIVLEYKFSGGCATCGQPVSTLSFDIEGGLYMVAYCDFCKKQLQSKKVIPIDQQSVDKTKSK